MLAKPEGKILLRIPRHRYENNKKIKIKEIGWECVCCFYLALNRDYWWPLVDTIMNFLK
jgi:hypothetical protein